MQLTLPFISLAALIALAIFASSVASTGLIALIQNSNNTIDPAAFALTTAHNAYPQVPIIAVVTAGQLGVADMYANDITIVVYISAENGVRNTSYLGQLMGSLVSYYVGGFFVDNMPSGVGFESYYKSLANITKSLGHDLLLITNPAVVLSSSYAGIANITCVYDKPSLPTTAELQSFDFPANQTCVIVTNVANPSEAAFDNLILYAEWIYLTDSYPNLPTYLVDLIYRMLYHGPPTPGTASAGGTTSNAHSFRPLFTIFDYFS